MPHLCAHCGAPVVWKRTTGGWLHAAPLAELRVSRRELQDILADPPPKGLELRRQSHIHPAQPE